MLLLLPALVLAHPSGGPPGTPGAARSTVGHRMELTVTDTDVDLRFVAEVPEQRVLEEARKSADPAYAETLLQTLADGVRLTWDKADLAATRVPVTDSAKAGEPGFLDFTVEWRAPLPSRTGTVGVRDGNYPDEPAFFATSVTLAGDLVAEETSLLHVKDGRVRDNWHGAWVRDESAREPWVRIRPAYWYERADAPEPLPQRMAGIERGAPPWWVTALAALGLLPIALLGRWLGRRAQRRR